MSIIGQRILGVLAVAVGVFGLVGMGIYEVANSCDRSNATATVADGATKSTTLKTSSGSCSASKSEKNASIYAMLAGSVGSSSCAGKQSAKGAGYVNADAKASGSPACGSKSVSAALTGYDSECAAKIASGECTPAECESKKAASAQFASAGAKADMYACSSEKKSSAVTASTEKSHCGSKEASAALVSSEGDKSSCDSKKSASASYASSGSCSSAKSADYAKAGASCTATVSACSDFKACSVKAGDLVRADGDKLKYYESEKAQDGVALADVKLPEFTAVNLAGQEVRSADLIGQPTVLVMLATHCGHSYQSQPILQQAAADYEAKGLRVVGLVVGSTTESAKKWIGSEGTGYDVWVTPDASVADALKSHLVPTYVLIDAQGNVKAKLIGFKDQQEVQKNIPVLLVQAGETQGTVDS